MNIHTALDWRYAVREFSSEKLPDSLVRSLLDATRKSASSYGLQPFNLILIESPTVRQKLLPASFGQQKVAESSHLVVFAAHKNIGAETVDHYIDRLIRERNVTPESVAGYASHMKEALASKTPEGKREWAHQQAYIALGTFLTSAAVMQIDCCPMTGFDHAAYDDILGLPDKGLETSAIAALGYRSPNDASADSKKVRVGYEEFVLTM